MSNKIGSFLLTGGFLLVACSPAIAGPTTTSFITSIPATATLEPSPTSAPLSLVIYDFQELNCQATWTNSGQDLPCPANIYEENLDGMVSLANESSMEGTQLIRDVALMTMPSQNGSFYGIFGAYPPIHVQGGDEFRARIGCMDNEPDTCNVQFALEYYDANGNYVDSQVTGWFWNEINDGVTRDIVIDLSFLAGETVRLTLVVRDNGDPSGDYALWLHPQLWRSQFNP